MAISDTIHSPATPVAPTAKPTAGSREKVEYIELFRGAAILFIIAGHAFDLAWSREPALHPVTSPGVLETVSGILTGGTFFFVFISGFLYRHVFYQRMPFGTFMQKKAVQVGIPYLVLGLVASLMQVFLSGFSVTIFKHGTELGQNAYVDLAVLFATGNMMTAYWYIPFIFVVFLASPLFDRFIELDRPRRFLILALSLVVAFLVHRPYEGLNPFHSFVYFTNVYLFGILFCEYRKVWLPPLMRPGILLALGLAVVVVAVVEYSVLHKVTDLERLASDGWRPLGFDLMIVQKYLAILFLVGVLARWGHLVRGPLSWIAEISFGLYFLHGFVLAGLTHLPTSAMLDTGSSLMNFPLLAGASILLTIGVTSALKYVLGRASRSMIGC